MTGKMKHESEKDSENEPQNSPVFRAASGWDDGEAQVEAADDC